jgi:hypothetical protein
MCIPGKLEVVPIVSPQTSQRANPKKPPPALENACDMIMSQSILGGEMLEFDFFFLGEQASGSRENEQEYYARNSVNYIFAERGTQS